MPRVKKEFNALRLMGLFWTAFGVIVLAAIFFVNVPPALEGRMSLAAARGVNAIAGGLLILAGVLCLVGGQRGRREKHSSED